MWERLRQADIAQAKQQLRLRVDETLLRHAEEIKKLDSDQTELEALNRLLDQFSSKFKTAPAAAAEPVAASEQDEAAAVTQPDEDVAATEQEQPSAAAEKDEPSAGAKQEKPLAAAAEDEVAAATAAGKQNEPAGASRRNQAASTNEQSTAAAAPSNAAAEKPTSKARNADQRERDRPRTNFDVFSRAITKQERW